MGTEVDLINLPHKLSQAFKEDLPRRITVMEWLGLEGTSNTIHLQLPAVAAYLPLNQAPDQAAHACYTAGAHVCPW